MEMWGNNNSQQYFITSTFLPWSPVPGVRRVRLQVNSCPPGVCYCLPIKPPTVTGLKNITASPCLLRLFFHHITNQSEYEGGTTATRLAALFLTPTHPLSTLLGK